VLRDLFSIRGLGGTVAFNVAMAGLGLVSGVVLARTLGPGGRGDLAAAIQWAGITLALSDMGLGFAIAHRAGAAPGQRGELWWFSLVVATAWGGLVLLGTSAVLPGLVHTSAAPALNVALWVVPFGLANGFQAYLLLGSGRVLAHNEVRLVASLAYALGVATIAFLGVRSVTAFASVFIASQVVGAAVGFALLARSLDAARMRDRRRARELVEFGLKSQVASIAGYAALRLDQLLLSVFASSADLGLYVIAVSSASVVGPLFSASAVLIIPRMSKLKDPVQGARALRKELSLVTVVCTPIIALTFAFMPQLVLLFFGPAFGGALVAARILTIASGFQGFNAVLGNAMRSMGRPGAPAIAESVGMAATLVLLVALLPSYGIIGAAVASLAAYALVTAAYLMLLKGRASETLPGGASAVVESTTAGDPYR
jgi:O-antigen/teichoic acid export membrane protein